MNLDLSEEETTALARLLRDKIDEDRYPLSPRIRTLQDTLDKLEPPPTREPLPPLKVYMRPREQPRREDGVAGEIRARPADDARRRRCGRGPADCMVQELPASRRARSGGDGCSIRRPDDRARIGKQSLRTASSGVLPVPRRGPRTL
jgi:hypothetical protein